VLLPHTSNKGYALPFRTLLDDKFATGAEMPILVRQKGSKWQRADDVVFADETQLQKMLYESPELISPRDQHPAVFIREAGLPGSGYTDLLGVDADGNILIVETNPSSAV
jgi:RecB family endonuclease NucS